MKTPRQESILESQLVLLLTHCANLLVGLYLTFMLARVLDTDEFTSFVLLAAALALASQLVDAGMQPALVAALSQDENRGQAFLGHILKRRLILAGVAASLSTLLAPFLPKNSWLWGLVFVATLLLPCRTFGAYFSATRRFRLASYGNLMIRIVSAFVILFATNIRVRALEPQFEPVLAALILREIALSLFPCMGLLLRKKPVTKLDIRPETRGLALMAAATVCSAAYFHLDLFMVRGLASIEEAGGYGFAARILGPVVVGVSLLLSPFLPYLSRGVREKESPHFRDVILIVIATLGLAIPMVCALQLSSPLVDPYYMRGLETAPDALGVLAWSLPFIVVGIAFSTSLIIAKRYREWALVTFTGLIVNLVLNAILIPFFAGLGAAWATVATEALVAILAVNVQRRLPARPALFDSKEVMGAAMASMAPSAVALGVYLILWEPEAPFRLLLAIGLVILVAVVHLFFGVPRTLRRRFEEHMKAQGGAT